MYKFQFNYNIIILLILKINIVFKIWYMIDKLIFNRIIPQLLIILCKFLILNFLYNIVVIVKYKPFKTIFNYSFFILH